MDVDAFVLQRLPNRMELALGILVEMGRFSKDNRVMTVTKPMAMAVLRSA